MGGALTPGKRRLIVGAAAIVAAVIVATLALWLAPSWLGPHGASASADVATATVLRPARCDAPNPHDQISVSVGGQQKQAQLDGCGNAQNSTVQVLLPSSVTSDSVLAEAGSGNESAGYRRWGFVLLALGGAAGAGYAFLLASARSRRGHGTTSPADATRSGV